jgi:oxygen-independent coproporphyrinogen-3 oxidase
MKIEVMNLAPLHPSSVPESLYLHYPVCKHVCSYCDFNVYSQAKISKESAEFNDVWLRTIAAHLQNFIPSGRYPLKTLYLGGGTPSLLSPNDLRSLRKILESRFILPDSLSAENFEFTLEANPETLTRESLKIFREIGVNRLSLGIQTFVPQQLKRLERLATAHKIEEVISFAQQEFKNFSLDWMIGIPDQTSESFLFDLEKFSIICPPHLSVYILTLAADHKLKTKAAIKERLVSDEGVQTIYLKVCEKLAELNYQHYEISNFSKTGFQSRHNQNYWNPESSYLALGPGAHGYINKIRYECIRDPLEWSKSATGFSTSEVLTAEQQKLESFYLRLRTRQPVCVSEVRHAAIPYLEQQKYIIVETDKIYLTESGWLLMESISQQLLRT